MAFKTVIPEMLSSATEDVKGIQKLINQGTAATKTTDGVLGTQALASLYDTESLDKAITPAGISMISDRSRKTITAPANFNDFITNGIWDFESGIYTNQPPVTTDGTNLISGFLRVTVDSNNPIVAVFQEYKVWQAGEASGQMFSRGWHGTIGSWSSWISVPSFAPLTDLDSNNKIVSPDWIKNNVVSGSGGNGIVEWDNTTKFVEGDFVNINGALYHCIKENGPGTDGGVINPTNEITSITAGTQAGETWNQVTLPVTSNWYSAIAVTQTGRIIVLGNDSTICIYSDNNGLTWNQVTLPVSGNWYGLVVTQTGRIVALGQNSTICIYSDNNGLTWTQVTLPVSANWYDSIIVTQTNRIIALGYNSSICIYSDNNGISWTQVTLPVSANWYGFIVVTQTNRIVALGYNSTICIYSDNNGLTWTQVTLPVSAYWYGIVVTHTGRIIALGNSSTICIYSDNNGISWTQVTLPITGNWRRIIVTHTGRIIVLRQNSTICIYSDNNGISWNQVTLPVTGNWYSVIVVTHTGRIIALGHSSTICIYSDTGFDTLTWNIYWERVDTAQVGVSVFSPGRNPSSRKNIRYTGALLSRTEYASLWDKTEKLYSPVPDAIWESDRYSTGDGSTTFRIPQKDYNFFGTNEFLKVK